jgi:hypothetical protein
MYAPNVFTLDIPSLMGGAVDSGKLHICHFLKAKMLFT